MKSYKCVVNLWSNFFYVISQLENGDERGALSLLLQLFTVCVLINLFPPLPLPFIAELSYLLILQNPALKQLTGLWKRINPFEVSTRGFKQVSRSRCKLLSVITFRSHLSFNVYLKFNLKRVKWHIPHVIFKACPTQSKKGYNTVTPPTFLSLKALADASEMQEIRRGGGFT